MMPPSLMCLLGVYPGNIYCLHVGNVCLFVHPSICPKAKSPSLSESFLSAIMLVSASLCISLYLSGSFCISLHFSGFLWISQILAIITISHHAFQPISYHTHQPSSTSTLTLLPISHHANQPSYLQFATMPIKSHAIKHLA